MANNLHNNLIRPQGMAPRAWTAYIKACKDAGMIPPYIVQSLGSAKASKGTHDEDGSVLVNGKWEKYTAAIDIRSRGLSEKQLKWLLYNLARNGFVAWYRHKGSFLNNKHIHAIYVGLKMKPSLRRQVQDFLVDRDGLANHGMEGFWTAPADLDAKLRTLFKQYNSD